MSNHKIAVICLVYNEEKRIERFIRSFYCYDEIIIIDKNSTDKTAQIAKNMGATVISIPYTDRSSVWNIGIEATECDWVFLLTASDVANPAFNKTLFNLIDDDEFDNNYDIIEYPCVMHVMGVESRYSVFDYDVRNGLFKKRICSIQDRVHEEFSFSSNRIYKMSFNTSVAVHHLSHESLDIYYDRQLRYSKEETKKDKTYGRCMLELFREIWRGIKKRFWKLGHIGVALLLMMINYRILIYLRYFEKEMGDIPSLYNKFASELGMNDKNIYRNSEYKKIEEES